MKKMRKKNNRKKSRRPAIQTVCIGEVILVRHHINAQ